MAGQDTVVLTLQVRYTRKLWEAWEEECLVNSAGEGTALDAAEHTVAVALIRDDEPLQVRGSVVPFEQAPELPLDESICDDGSITA